MDSPEITPQSWRVTVLRIVRVYTSLEGYSNNGSQRYTGPGGLRILMEVRDTPSPGGYIRDTPQPGGYSNNGVVEIHQSGGLQYRWIVQRYTRPGGLQYKWIVRATPVLEGLPLYNGIVRDTPVLEEINQSWWGYSYNGYRSEIHQSWRVTVYLDSQTYTSQEGSYHNESQRRNTSSWRVQYIRDSQRLHSPGGLQYIMDSSKHQSGGLQYKDSQSLHQFQAGLQYHSDVRDTTVLEGWRVTYNNGCQRIHRLEGYSIIMDVRDTPVLEGFTDKWIVRDTPVQEASTIYNG
ncbi:unnamed protein product [Coregonus sp. 'balchen']|nr:unnamed protein product [Coregonus sp. 'balchen']